MGCLRTALVQLLYLFIHTTIQPGQLLKMSKKLLSPIASVGCYSADSSEVYPNHTIIPLIQEDITNVSKYSIYQSIDDDYPVLADAPHRSQQPCARH